MRRRDSGGRFTLDVDPPRSKPSTHYRIITFRRPRTPWRASREEAIEDAKRLGLTAYDASRREHYLAVPTAIDTFTGFGLPPAA